MSSTIEQSLSQAGLRATPRRLEVMRVLEASGEQHMTADDVYLGLAQKGVRLGVSTVYRVLAELEASGIVKRSQFGQPKARFKLSDGTAHFHMVAPGDGEIRAFDDSELSRRLQELAAELGYELLDMEVTLYVEPRRETDATRSRRDATEALGKRLGPI